MPEQIEMKTDSEGYECVDIFSCFIDEVRDGIAYISTNNSEDIMHHMDIPRKDLEDNKIKDEAGICFILELKKKGDLEKLVFTPIEWKKMTKKEIQERLEYYRQEYGDI